MTDREQLFQITMRHRAFQAFMNLRTHMEQVRVLIEGVDSRLDDSDHLHNVMINWDHRIRILAQEIADLEKEFLDKSE